MERIGNRARHNASATRDLYVQCKQCQGQARTAANQAHSRHGDGVEPNESKASSGYNIAIACVCVEHHRERGLSI